MLFELEQQVNKRSLRSPMKSYLWRVELPEVLTASSFNNFEISSRITSISIPFHQIETAQAKFGNGVWNYGQSVAIGQITLDVMEYDDGDTLQFFQDWKSLMMNKGEGGSYVFNPPYEYKKIVRFYRLDTMKEDVLVIEYTGFFVSGIAESANDYESNTPVRYSITLTGDDVQYGTVSTFKESKQSFLDKINKSKSILKPLKDLLF